MIEERVLKYIINEIKIIQLHYFDYAIFLTGNARTGMSNHAIKYEPRREL